jgi:hypothetical protein
MSDCSVDFATFTVACGGATYVLEPVFEFNGAEVVDMDTYRVSLEGNPVGTIAYSEPLHRVAASGTRITQQRLQTIADAWFAAIGSALDQAEAELE